MKEKKHIFQSKLTIFFNCYKIVWKSNKKWDNVDNLNRYLRHNCLSQLTKETVIDVKRSEGSFADGSKHATLSVKSIKLRQPLYCFINSPSTLFYPGILNARLGEVRRICRQSKQEFRERTYDHTLAIQLQRRA